jgi:hypothetical protein
MMDKTDGTLPGDTLPGDTLPEELCGLWDSYADNYAISPARLEYDYSSGEAWHLAFAGSIRHVSVFDAESGVIIVEYTEAPEVPYQKGRSDFIAVYYRIVAAGAVKFWHSFDMTGTDTADLEAAREKFSRENSSRFVFSWDSAYTLYRQDAVPLDMGPLRGTWLAGDGFPTWLRITDYRL